MKEVCLGATADPSGSGKDRRVVVGSMYMGSNMTKQTKTKHFAKLVDALRSFQDDGAAIIIAGDFNMTPPELEDEFLPSFLLRCLPFRPGDGATHIGAKNGKSYATAIDHAIVNDSAMHLLPRPPITVDADDRVTHSGSLGRYSQSFLRREIVIFVTLCMLSLGGSKCVCVWS